jgi:hypothetical protein
MGAFTDECFLPGPLDPHAGGCADDWTSCSDCPVIYCHYNVEGPEYRGKRRMRQLSLLGQESHANPRD